MRRSSLCLSLVAVLTFATLSSARAQPRPKHDATAVGLSLGVSAASLATVFLGFATERVEIAAVGGAGLLVGPSTGVWYAHRVGGVGLLMRSVGMGLVVVGIEMGSGLEDCGSLGPVSDCTEWDASNGRRRQHGAEALFAGALLWGTSIGWDLVSAHRGVTAWNREHGWTIAPTMVSAGGRRAPGVSLGFRF